MIQCHSIVAVWFGRHYILVLYDIFSMHIESTVIVCVTLCCQPHDCTVFLPSPLVVWMMNDLGNSLVAGGNNSRIKIFVN